MLIMRIAISGASGYIGYHLIDKLAQKNSILAITRKKTEKLSALCSKYADNISVCELLSDDMFLDVAKFNPDYIISTTCCYETDSRFLEKTVDSNYTFPSLLLKCAIQNPKIGGGLVSFINIGTSLPATLNLYTLTKKQFSELGSFFAKIGKIQFIDILLESFYGSDEPENRFIPSTIRKLLKNEDINVTKGIQCRDYIAVEDVIDILCFLINSKIQEQVLSISAGSGEAPSIREIIEYLKKETNSNSTINYGAIPSRPNEPSSKANLSVLRKIGYNKEMIFWKDGMAKMIQKIKNNNF